MDNLFEIRGKKAIVVGAAGDLGYSMMEALLESGAHVVAIDIDESLKDLYLKFQDENFKFDYILCDISNREEIYESFNKAMILLDNQIDILINSAGIQRRFSSEVFPIEEWDKVISINLTAMFLYSQLASMIMIESGSGKIINVASMNSFFGGITIPAYAASKGGVSQLTKALSNDWASKGICVNAIAPGYMDTKMNVALINDPIRNAEALLRIPKKRWGNGNDLKGAVVFLSSKASDYITGIILPVDGGYLAR
jgi:2-deoxy-D-gluconate 3-dehydrogenase